MSSIRALFGRAPAGTSKVSYGWWSNLHNCHGRAYATREFSDYLQLLFDRGYATLFGEQPQSDDPLNELTDMFSKRSKTVKVTITQAQADEIDRLARMKSISSQDVVGHCLRVGYSIAC